MARDRRRAAQAATATEQEQRGETPPTPTGSFSRWLTTTRRISIWILCKMETQSPTIGSRFVFVRGPWAQRRRRRRTLMLWLWQAAITSPFMSQRPRWTWPSSWRINNSGCSLRQIRSFFYFSMLQVWLRLWRLFKQRDSLQVHSEEPCAQHLWGGHGHLLCIWADWFWQDSHYGRGVQGKEPGLQ